MNTKLNARSACSAQTILIVLMLCVTVIFSSGSYANAQGGGKNTASISQATEGEAIHAGPIADGPGFIMVSPYDFIASSSDANWAFTNGCLYNQGTSVGVMVAGLTLPHGATITKVTLYYKDASTSDLRLIFGRKDATFNMEKMAEIITQEAWADFRSAYVTVSTTPIIDNESYSYFLYAYFPGNVSTNVLITNVRIDYAYTASAPLIMK